MASPIANIRAQPALILCFSRFCLAVEYATTYLHARAYRRARLPLLLQTLLNVATGAVYLGITFRFEHYDNSGHNSRVFVTWYFIAAGEALLTIILSNFWRALSFTRTHLMKRMSLLTVMILGDGIVSIAQNVVTIVKRPDAWSKSVPTTYLHNHPTTYKLTNLLRNEIGRAHV